MPDSLLSDCPLFIIDCEKTLNENGTEITLVMYHPVLHKVVWIARYKASGLSESSQAVEYVLECFLQCVMQNIKCHSNQYKQSSPMKALELNLAGRNSLAHTEKQSFKNASFILRNRRPGWLE